MTQLSTIAPPQTPIKGGISFRIGIPWGICTVFGFLLSLLVIEIGEKPDLGLFPSLLGGSIVGFAQYLTLHRSVARLQGWIVANALVWGVMTCVGIGAVGWFIPHTRLFPLRLVYGIGEGAIAGFLIGLTQWFLLWDRGILAKYWIIVTTLSWAIALPLGWLLGGLLRSLTHLFLGEVVGLVGTWSIVGSLTGLFISIATQNNLTFPNLKSKL